jgi:[methyl-Co(III) methanol-specific corrinoid protein]:coenzyme M methyltransferase
MTNEIMNQREEILSLLSGKKINGTPAFSGLIHVTAEGLQGEGLAFHEVHRDGEKMAKAAASTFKLTGLPSAVAPLDMLVEAEALGAQIDFRENGEYEFPRARKFLFESGVQCLKTLEGLEATPKSEEFGVPDSAMGRIGLVCKAITKLKKDVGEKTIVGGLIPGPYTLLLFLVEPAAMFTEMKREPQVIQNALIHLSSFLVQVGTAYRNAGADFITIHDMGGSPAFIGPAKYEQFVLPAEKSLIEKLPKPRVLSVCGNTNKSMHLLAQTGADALSVDQTNDLAASRAALNDTLLFGNIDPVATLWQGDEAQVTAAVIRAKEAGVDAIWPGCDLVLETPIQNIRALQKA